MWRSIFLLWLITLSSCAVHKDQPAAAPKDQPAIEGSVFTPELTAALQTQLEQLNQKLGNLGMSASLYISDRCYWESAVGVTQQNTEVAIKPDMLFNFASVTKTFVAAIVLQLVEEQKLDLDEPLGNWVAPYNNIDPKVTIRQLLNHGSGFANYFNGEFYRAELEPDPDRIWLPEELLQHVDPPRSLGFASPGYSNTNYLLLGVIIEAVTGNSFEQELKDRIIDPLNLKYTHLPKSYFKPERWANSSFLLNSIYSSVWTAGGIASTSKEIATFYQALNSGDLLQAETLEIMRKTEHRAIASGGFQMGLGVWLIQVDNDMAWGHGGSLYPYLSRALYLPKYNLSIAYSSTGEKLKWQGLPGRHLLATYLEHLPEDMSVCFDA